MEEVEKMEKQAELQQPENIAESKAEGKPAVDELKRMLSEQEKRYAELVKLLEQEKREREAAKVAAAEEAERKKKQKVQEALERAMKAAAIAPQDEEAIKRWRKLLEANYDDAAVLLEKIIEAQERKQAKARPAPEEQAKTTRVGGALREGFRQYVAKLPIN